MRIVPSKPLRPRVALARRSNELDRSGGRPPGRSQFSKKEWSMAQSRESTGSEQSRSGASGSSGSGSSAERAGSGSGGASSGGASMGGQGTEIIGQAQDQAMKLVDTARQQATSQIGMQQQRVAGTLNTVATALHDASREMRNQDETAIAEYVDTAASQVEQFAAMLREQDLEQLMATTAQFARRQPALFLGAAFVLGFAATRFIKSSSPSSGGQMSSRDYGLWYERPDGYGASSYSSGYGYGGAVSDLGYSGTTGSTGQMGDSSSFGSSGGIASFGTMGSESGFGSAGTGSFDSGMGSSGSMGSTGSSGSSGSSDSGGSGGSTGSGSFGASSGSSASSASGTGGSSGFSGSGGSTGSGSQGGSGSGGSRSGSEGQSRSSTGSGAGGQ